MTLFYLLVRLYAITAITNAEQEIINAATLMIISTCIILQWTL